ncbi:collagen-like triple helix repeat-containing protein [Lachnospiraceae bacterium LCP19S3_B12]
MARTMEEIEEEIRKVQKQRRQSAVQGSGNTAGQSQMNSQEIEERIRAEQKKRTQEYSRNRAKYSFGGPTQDIYQGREHLYHAEGTNHFIDPKATDYRAQGNNLLNNQLTQADTDRLSYQQNYDFLSDAAKESLRQYQKYQDLSINPTVDDATRKKAASSAKYINDTYDDYLGEDGFRQFLNYKKEADNAMTVKKWEEKVKDEEEQGLKTLTEEQEKRLYELWNQQADAQTAFAAKEGLEEFKKELVKSGWTDQEAEDVLAEGKVSDPTRTPQEELEYASDYINQTLDAEQKATLQRYLEARTNIGESMAALQGGRANGTQYDPDDMQRAKQALLDSGLEEEELSRLVQYGQELNDYYDRLEQQQLAYDQTHTGSGFKDALGGIKNSVDAVLVSPAAGFLSIGESLNRGNYPDQAAPVNTNSRMYTLTNLNTDLKAATAQRISETPAGELGAKAYQVGMSIGESAFGTWMGGKLGALTQAAGASEKAVKLVTNLSTLPSFGANAYAVTLQEAQERGIDTDDAVATALVAGLAEMATEVWSLDHFWDIAKSQGTKAARNAVIDVLAQAGVEGSEEVASDLINRAADAIINGDQSAYNQSVQESISQGMTEEEAKQKANKEAIQGTVESFLGGAASGGIMGSAAQGVKLVTDTQSAKQMFADGDYQSFAEAIDTDEASYTNKNAWETAKEAQALAKDYAARSKEGGSIRTQEQRKLYNLVMDTAEIESGNRKAEANAVERQSKKDGQTTRRSLEIPEQTYEETDVPKAYQSQGISESEMFDRMAKAQTAEELTEAYRSGRETADGTARRLADNAYQQYSGKLLTEGKVTQAQLDAAMSRPTKAQAYLEGANGTAQDALDLTDETRIAYNEGVRRRTEELASRTVQNAEDIREIRIRGVGTQASVTYNQATVSAEDFRAKSFGVQTLVNQALNQNTEAAANGYLAHYPAGVPITSYTKAFQTFYDAGAAGVKGFKETMKANRYMAALVPESTLESIFTLGGKELSIKDQTAIKTAIREGTGTVKDLRTNKTQEVALLPVYEAYAKATGTTIVLKDDMDAHINGSFRKATSEIVFNTGSDKAFSTFFHEAVGEYTQAWNAEGMKEVQEAILSYVVESKGAEYLSRTGRRYQSAYMAQEGTKSFREAMDEYVNDGISGLFTSKEGMRQFAKWLDDHQKASKRNVLQCLADWIKNVVDSLKKALTGSRLSEATKTVAEMNIERANKLRTQILDALSVASEHQAKAAKTGDLTEAEVKYSLEVAEGTTLEERIQDALEHPKEQSHIYIQDTPKSLQEILGIGDLPMLMTSNHIYSVVKTAEEWLTSLKGEKGDKGDTGSTGPQGETGATGPQGPAGADGKTPTFSINSEGHLIATYE